MLLDKLTGLLISQEIHHILWIMKVHLCTHNSPPPFAILSQLNPVHVTPSHFLKIRFNIIFPFRPGSSKWSRSLRFLHQNTVHTSPFPHTCYVPRPSHLLYLIIRIKFGEEYRAASSTDLPPVQIYLRYSPASSTDLPPLISCINILFYVYRWRSYNKIWQLKRRYLTVFYCVHVVLGSSVVCVRFINLRFK